MRWESNVYLGYVATATQPRGAVETSNLAYYETFKCLSSMLLSFAKLYKWIRGITQLSYKKQDKCLSLWNTFGTSLFLFLGK